MIDQPYRTVEGAAAWETVFAAPHRFEYIFVIAGVEYTMADIQPYPGIERTLMDEPCVGKCGSSTLSLTVVPKEDIPKGAEIKALCRMIGRGNSLYTSWYELGTFKISTRRAQGKYLALNCRDLMTAARQTYTDKTRYTEWPVRMDLVVSEIAQIMGVEIDDRTEINGTYMVDYPNEDDLMYDVLAMCAAAHGGLFIMTPQNKLRLVPYPDTRSVESVQDVAGAYTKYTPYSTGIKTVSRITLSDIADNQFTQGTDGGEEIVGRCDYATQEIVDNIYSVLSGAEYIPFNLSGAYLNPLIELGDVFTITRQGEVLNLIVGVMKTVCNVSCSASVTFGVQEDDEDEFPYISTSDRNANKYVLATKAYYGNRINRKDGFVSELVKDNDVVARLKANASVFAMQQKVDGVWKDRIYFDPVAGKYKITGDVEIAGAVTFENLVTQGQTVINGANITTGTVNTNQVKIAGSDNFMWNEEYIVAKNPGNANQQIRYGLYNGSDMGLAFTTDGGKTWQNAIGFDGVVLRAGSVTKSMLASDINFKAISDGTEAPTDASDSDLWIDTSVSPPVLKRYDAEKSEWVVLNDADLGDLTNIEKRLEAAEQKITDSAIISTVTSSQTFISLQNTANDAKSTADSAKTKADSAAATVSGYEQRLQTAEQKITDSAIISTVTSSKTYTDALSGKVSTTEVISCINQTAESVKIKAAKIEFDGAVITNGTLTTGNWTFDSNGSKYSSSSGVRVNMTVMNGDFVGGGTSTRAFYGSSNCDVQYGADYGYTTFIRSKEITIVAHNNSDMADYKMATFSKYPGPKDYEDFTFYCNESEEDSPAGNLGYAEQPWDTIYVNKCFRLSENTFSSKYVKHDIMDLPDMGELLDALRPVSFSYNYKHVYDQVRYGLILEDAVKVLPAICTIPTYAEGSTEYLSEASISYTDLIAPMLKEIQLLRARVKSLEMSIS